MANVRIAETNEQNLKAIEALALRVATRDTASLSELEHDLRIDPDGWFNEAESDRLTDALQRSTAQDVIEYAGRMGYTETERTALLAAHAALQAEESEGEPDMVDIWAEQCQVLMDAASTMRQRAVILYADTCMQCAGR